MVATFSKHDPVIPFGVHKGKHASDIDVKYLDWLLGQDWFCGKFMSLKGEIVLHLKNRPEWLEM